MEKELRRVDGRHGVIWKRCSRCGRRVEEGKSCPCGAGCRRGENRTDGIRKEYHSARWKKIREAVLVSCSHVDPYALYRDGRVIPADRVHHIIPVLSKPEGFYDMANLFPCSEGSHNEIHKRYRHEGEEAVQEELRRYKRRFFEDKEREA